METYAVRISKMSNEELIAETKDKIYSSALWSHTSHISHEEVDACYNEWVKRDGDDSTYKRIHQETREEYTR